MKDKLETQLTFFLLNRNVLGAIWVIKRMAFAFTIDQAIDGTTRGIIIMLAIREGLSALTDYSQTKDPVVTTNKSSPPNPTPEPMQTPDAPG